VLGACLSERPQFGWHAALIVSVGTFTRTRKFSRTELSLRGVELRDRGDLMDWLQAYELKGNGLWLPAPATHMPGDQPNPPLDPTPAQRSPAPRGISGTSLGS